jgi:membrane protein
MTEQPLVNLSLAGLRSLSVTEWKLVARRSWREAEDDNIGIIAAGVAFYSFLAFVPLLGTLVLAYGLLADMRTVIHDVRRLTSVMPPDAAHLVGQQLVELVKTSNGKKGLGVVGALTMALFGTRNGAGSIITALNIAYEVNEKRGFFVLNALSLAITTTAVVAAIVAMAAIAALGHLQHLLPAAPGLLLVLGKVASYVLLGLVGTVSAATLYRYGPARRGARWIWITPGSLLATACWLLLTLGFGVYVAQVGRYNATYGSLSAVVVLLTWLYLSSYALLFGAEVNSEVARLQLRKASSPKATVPPVPSAKAITAAMRGLAGQTARSLPFALAAMGLSMLGRRGKGLGGAALVAMASVTAWLHRGRQGYD